MFIPHKVLKSESYSPEYLAAHQRLSKRLGKILKIHSNSNEIKNLETLNELLNIPNETPSRALQQNSLDIVDWLFKKDLEERIKICSIQNKWFASFFISLVQIYKENPKVAFCVKFNERSEDLLKSLIKESFKITYLNSNNVDITFSSDLYATITTEEEDTISNEILKELSVVDLEFISISRKILKSKCEFMRFFSTFSNNRFLSSQIEVYKTSLLNVSLPDWVNQSKISLGELFLAFFDQNLQVKYYLKTDKQDVYPNSTNNGNKVSLLEESSLSQVISDVQKLTGFLSGLDIESIKNDLMDLGQGEPYEQVSQYKDKLITAMASENSRKTIKEFLEEVKFIPVDRVDHADFKLRNLFYQYINDFYSRTHATELINNQSSKDSKQKAIKKKSKKPNKEPKIDEIFKEMTKNFVYNLVNNAVKQSMESPHSIRKASSSTRPDHSDANATTDFANYSSSTTTYEDRLPFMKRRNKKKRRNENLRNSKKGNKNEEENADLQFTKRLSQRKSNFEEDREIQKDGKLLDLANLDEMPFSQASDKNADISPFLKSDVNFVNINRMKEGSKLRCEEKVYESNQENSSEQQSRRSGKKITSILNIPENPFKVAKADEIKLDQSIQEIKENQNSSTAHIPNKRVTITNNVTNITNITNVHVFNIKDNSKISANPYQAKSKRKFSDSDYVQEEGFSSDSFNYYNYSEYVRRLPKNGSLFQNFNYFPNQSQNFIFDHRLHCDILNFSNETEQFIRDTSYFKSFIIDSLNRQVSAILNHRIKFDIFGSFAYGLSIENSDIDIMLRSEKFENISKLDFWNLFRQLTEGLQGLGFYDEVFSIPTATVPVIKLVANLERLLPPYQLGFLYHLCNNYKFHPLELLRVRVDLTFSTFVNEKNQRKELNCKSVEFVRGQLAAFPEIKPLVHVLKRLLHVTGLNNSFNGIFINV